MAVGFILLGYFYVSGFEPGYIASEDTLEKAVKIPSFDFLDLGGDTVSSTEILGDKAILIAFWSMYCRACVEKFGALVEIRRQYSPETIEIISVNTDGEYRLPDEAIRDFIKGLETRENFKLNFPVVYDRENTLAKQLGIIFLPAIIAVDTEGNIIGTYRRFSEDSDEEIIRGIRAIIPADVPALSR